MPHTAFTVALRNAEAARVIRNLTNQNLTITYTFTVASTADLGQGILGTLAGTTVAVTPPPEVNPIGTNPDVAPATISN